jgi:hypothetical protein
LKRRKWRTSISDPTVTAASNLPFLAVMGIVLITGIVAAFYLVGRLPL